MMKKTGNFQNFSMDDAIRISQSDAAQQLYSLLQQQHADQLSQAMEQASNGNYDQVKKTMSQLLSDPEAAALLKKLKG